MKTVSLTYFVDFALVIPLASHMLVYGLYHLRTYLAQGWGAAEAKTTDAGSSVSRQRTSATAAALYGTLSTFRRSHQFSISQVGVAGADIK